jgi:Fe-S cluster biogenesis protein NfuA
MFLSRLFKRSKECSESIKDPDAATPAAADPAPLALVNTVKDKTPMQEEIHVYVQPTPNPNAFKFIVTKDVKRHGTATYADAETADNELAKSLLNVPGVEQIYFFDNVITATLNSTVPLSEVRERLTAVIKDKLPAHDPEYKTESDRAQQAYDDLPEDLKRINEILDNTIRPGLQGDGGNIEVLSYENHNLSVRYQGACGSCPSSTMGTLQAISQILKDEFDPEIEVTPV